MPLIKKKEDIQRLSS